jgi:hypothetical protein
VLERFSAIDAVLRSSSRSSSTCWTRHVVDELRQFFDVDVGQQVGPRGEQLAQLDERRAELLERLPEPNRSFARRQLAADDAHLAQHAQEMRAPSDHRHLERALRLALLGHPAANLPS